MFQLRYYNNFYTMHFYIFGVGTCWQTLAKAGINARKKKKVLEPNTVLPNRMRQEKLNYLKIPPSLVTTTLLQNIKI